MCVLEDLYRRYGPSTPEGENLRRGQELLRAGEYEQSLGYFDLAQQLSLIHISEPTRPY